MVEGIFGTGSSQPASGEFVVDENDSIQSVVDDAAADGADVIKLYASHVYDEGAEITLSKGQVLKGNNATITVSSDHNGVFVDNHCKILDYPKIDVTETAYTSRAVHLDTSASTDGAYGFGTNRRPVQLDVEITGVNTNAGSVGLMLDDDATNGIYGVRGNPYIRRFDHGVELNSDNFVSGNRLNVRVEGSATMIAHTGSAKAVTDFVGFAQPSTGGNSDIFLENAAGNVQSLNFKGSLFDPQDFTANPVQGPFVNLEQHSGSNTLDANSNFAPDFRTVVWEWLETGLGPYDTNGAKWSWDGTGGGRGSMVQKFDGNDAWEVMEDGGAAPVKQDLSTAGLKVSANDGKVFAHNGNSSITADGGSTSAEGLYVYSDTDSEWKQIVTY